MIDNSIDSDTEGGGPCSSETKHRVKVKVINNRIQIDGGGVRGRSTFVTKKGSKKKKVGGAGVAQNNGNELLQCRLPTIPVKRSENIEFSKFCF